MIWQFAGIFGLIRSFQLPTSLARVSIFLQSPDSVKVGKHKAANRFCPFFTVWPGRWHWHDFAIFGNIWAHQEFSFADLIGVSIFATKKLLPPCVARPLTLSYEQDLDFMQSCQKYFF
jgi:hypothetical protein